MEWYVNQIVIRDKIGVPPPVSSNIDKTNIDIYRDNISLNSTYKGTRKNKIQFFVIILPFYYFKKRS